MRTLTELRHTPASPSLLRKATGQQQAHNNPSSIVQHNAVLQITRASVERSRSASQERGSVGAQTASTAGGSGQVGQTAVQGQGPGGVGQGFMAVLNAKLIGTISSSTSAGANASGSPKSLRKQSISEQQQQQQQSKNVKTAAPGFLETLNAKLAQQQQALQQAGTSRSASVRRIMGNRVPIMDPVQVRDSLMDQIRRGTSLKKTSGPINDRSAPKIY